MYNLISTDDANVYIYALHLTVSFKIYDFDSDNYISQQDLTRVLAATLKENDLVFSQQEVDEIVEITMKEAMPAVPGMISYEE